MPATTLPPVRPAVAALLAAAVLLAVARPAPAESRPRWQWPLEPRPRVVSGFDAPDGPYSAGHRGVDLAAGVGQEVRAAGAGVVAFAGSVAGRGVVSVIHADGRRTTYEPVTPALAVGDAVAPGAPIGRVSAAPGHCLPATCLHWGLRDGETYQDPLSLVGAAPVRLLPVWGRTVPVRQAQAAQPWTPGTVTIRDRGPLMAGLGGPR